MDATWQHIEQHVTHTPPRSRLQTTTTCVLTRAAYYASPSPPRARPCSRPACPPRFPPARPLLLGHELDLDDELRRRRTHLRAIAHRLVDACTVVCDALFSRLHPGRIQRRTEPLFPPRLAHVHAKLGRHPVDLYTEPKERSFIHTRPSQHSLHEPLDHGRRLLHLALQLAPRLLRVVQVVAQHRAIPLGQARVEGHLVVVLAADRRAELSACLRLRLDELVGILQHPRDAVRVGVLVGLGLIGVGVVGLQLGHHAHEALDRRRLARAGTARPPEGGRRLGLEAGVERVGGDEQLEYVVDIRILPITRRSQPSVHVLPRVHVLVNVRAHAVELRPQPERGVDLALRRVAKRVELRSGERLELHKARLFWVLVIGPEPRVGDHVEERPLELRIVRRHALERSFYPAQREPALLNDILLGPSLPRRDTYFVIVDSVPLRIPGGEQAVVRVRRVWRVELPDGLGRPLGRKRHPVIVVALGLGLVVLVGRRQRELPAPHRRCEPRSEAAAAVACPPLLHCDGTVPVDVEPPEERLDFRAVGHAAGSGERAQQLLQIELARLVCIDGCKRGGGRGLGLRLPWCCVRLQPLKGHFAVSVGVKRLEQLRDGLVLLAQAEQVHHELGRVNLAALIGVDAVEHSIHAIVIRHSDGVQRVWWGAARGGGGGCRAPAARE
eukprot:scaffold2912_cov68-Phaeocystis_antarctica.AAC.5